MGIQGFSSSKHTVKEYKDLINRPNIFRNKVGSYFDSYDWSKQEPLVLGYHFIRNSKRSFDYINACQIIFDLLSAHDFIPDDDMQHLVPVPLKIDSRWWHVDKDSPGVILKILN